MEPWPRARGRLCLFFRWLRKSLSLIPAGCLRAGREHEGFLAAGDGDIDAPIIHLEGKSADAGDAIDDEERFAGGADDSADLLEVADGGGAGFGMDEDDGVVFGGAQLSADLLGRD